MQINLEKITLMSLEDATDEQKEEWYGEIVHLNVSKDVGHEELVRLFDLAREIMKFKGEQVEFLNGEIDNLAARLGEEEAKQPLLDEISDLRSQLNRFQNLNTDPSLDVETARHQLVTLEIQKEQLSSELQEKERELLAEKNELENVSSRLKNLEEENKMLKDELTVTREELSSGGGNIGGAGNKMVDTPDQLFMEKYRELTELLHQKNKHITQLLADIEDVEKENFTLKNKLSNMKEEFSSEVERFNHLSNQNNAFKTVNEELKERVSSLENENCGLRNHVADLVAEKEERDKQLGKVSGALEERVEQWKELMRKKDAELASLRAVVSAKDGHLDEETPLLIRFSNARKALAEREEEIRELKARLERTGADLDESAKSLEDFKKWKSESEENNCESAVVKLLNKKLEQAEHRIVILESRAEQAEEEALKKSEETTELITQLREYESGTLGLAEAVVRIKEVQKQKRVRDKHIEKLVQSGNEMREEINALESENNALREKLGIPRGESIVIDGVRLRMKRDKLAECEAELDKCKDELIEIKLANRRLRKELKKNSSKEIVARSISRNKRRGSSVGGEISLGEVSGDESLEDNSNTRDVKEKFREIVDENEGLRKGMHEILDSIRNQDGSDRIVEIHSETLEQLLEALDARHVSGWYQPAMRLQARVHLLNGVNHTLREELRIYREKDEQVRGLLETLIRQNAAFSGKTNRLENVDVVDDGPSSKSEYSARMRSPSEDVEIEGLKQELSSERDKTAKLLEERDNWEKSTRTLETRLEELRGNYEVSVEGLKNEKVALQKEMDVLKGSRDDCRVKIEEYEKLVQILKNGSDEEIKREISENVSRISNLKVDLRQLSRKCDVLIEINEEMKREFDKKEDDYQNQKRELVSNLATLKREKGRLEMERNELDDLLKSMVSLEEHDRLRDEFDRMVLKHREVLHAQLTTESENEKLLRRMEKELVSIGNQKLNLEEKLKGLLEENAALKMNADNIPPSEQVETLLKRVAAAQMDLENFKQSAEHAAKMYELAKEQLSEADKRCKLLEDQLGNLMGENSRLQEEEISLRHAAVMTTTLGDHKDLQNKCDKLGKELVSANAQIRELKELSDIASDQIKGMEETRILRDLSYDSTNRRILELQSASDDKIIIDRLGRELSLLQRNEITINSRVNDLIALKNKLESKLMEAELRLEECRGEKNEILRNDRGKIKLLHAFVREFQRRCLGSLPLVTEQIWCQSLNRAKTEYNILISATLKAISRHGDNNAISEDGNGRKTGGKSRGRSGSGRRGKSEWLEKSYGGGGGWNNHADSTGEKVAIYEERLERQEKLIARLEEEMRLQDEECRNFLASWNSAIEGVSTEGGDFNSRFTQTSREGSGDYEDGTAMEEIEELRSKLNQANAFANELNSKLQLSNSELQNLTESLRSGSAEMRRKDALISEKEREIARLREKYRQEVEQAEQIGLEEGKISARKDGKSGEQSVEKLALKTTVDTLQNIVNQKEETIKRYQNLLKECREEHAANVSNLRIEVKTLRDALEASQQSYARAKSRLECLESTGGRTSEVEVYAAKVHELQDELNRCEDGRASLTVQLKDRNDQLEKWSKTAEGRLKILQDMRSELEKAKPNTGECAKQMTTDNATIALIKGKCEEISRLQQANDELRKKLSKSCALGNRNHLKMDLDLCRKKLEKMERKERDDKAEIQRLKNQFLSRRQSSVRSEGATTAKEEALSKKVKALEQRLEEYAKREAQWKASKKVKCDEQVEKWTERKNYEKNLENLRQHLKEKSSRCEALNSANERLKETIVRLERERVHTEAKLKSFKAADDGKKREDLEETIARLEQECCHLRKKLNQLGMDASTQKLVESQERKISALQAARKGDSGLAAELENLHERKSQLQKCNVRLREENARLKLEVEKAKMDGNLTFECSMPKSCQGKEEKSKRNDLERTVVVLRRLVEKLQAENKRLHDEQIDKIRDKSLVEKLQSEMKVLQESYLDAMERSGELERDLETANKKVDALRQLAAMNGRSHGGGGSGEHESPVVSALNAQIQQKNQLLAKVKGLLEKAASREKELNERINFYRRTEQLRRTDKYEFS